MTKEQIELIKRGEWQMFELITSVYYGKQYYFLEPGERVYSRASSKSLTIIEAIDEFLDTIGWNNGTEGEANDKK